MVINMKTENLAEEKKVNNWTQYFWVFIGLAGFTFSLVVLYLAMRAVMDVGGYCAEGGAYNVAVHCPRGVAYLTPLSIFGLFVFGTVYITNALMDDWNVSFFFGRPCLERWGGIFWIIVCKN